MVDSNGVFSQQIDVVVFDRQYSPFIFRYEGQRIAQFGIRRGSKEQGHDYIPLQLHLTRKQCLDLRACPLSLDDYVRILRTKNLI